VVGGSIPGCEIATLLDGKLCSGRKIPHVCKKKKQTMQMIYKKYYELLL